VVEALLGDLHRVVSGVQLGITLTSLAIGALGEATFCENIQAIWPAKLWNSHHTYTHAIALACAFALLSSLHVVIGELVPKTVSLARAERVALLVALPFHWFLNTFHWAIHLLRSDIGCDRKGFGSQFSASSWRGAFNGRIADPNPAGRERGLDRSGEEKFILSAMELAQIQVREDHGAAAGYHTLSVEAELDEVMRVFATTQRSRIPVYRGNADHILGFVHIKDMIWILLDRERRLEENLSPPPFDLRRVLREVLISAGDQAGQRIAARIAHASCGHGAGGGRVWEHPWTCHMEDILEQMVGRFTNEFDVVERPLTLADGSVDF